VPKLGSASRPSALSRKAIVRHVVARALPPVDGYERLVNMTELAKNLRSNIFAVAQERLIEERR